MRGTSLHLPALASSPHALPWERMTLCSIRESNGHSSWLLAIHSSSMLHLVTAGIQANPMQGQEWPVNPTSSCGACKTFATHFTHSFTHEWQNVLGE